jgi:TrmH family RNA methyltransferase
MIRDLGRRRGRERRGLALAEGVRLVEEALAAGVAIRGAAVSPALEGTTRGTALKRVLADRRVPLEEISLAELDALADTEHPQGIVAVIEPRRWTLDDIPAGPGVTLVLDAVQDPGNVGTILRTAHALGAAGVIALKGTADLVNPKVLRGSMGSAFRFPAVPAGEADLLDWASARGAALWVTSADGEPLRRDAVRAAGAVLMVVGNEGAGVGSSLASRAARRVAIPIRSGAESLNVAVASGILLYEALRDG